MADSKRISYSQIAEPNLLEPLKKEIQEVNNLLGITGENLKAVIAEAAKIAKQTPLDSFENLEKVEKGLNDASKAVKELDKVERDRLKLQERLKELDDERTKANFDLREQIRLQTKELRDNARAAAASGDAYERLKKETNDAQKEAKRLATEFGVNSDEAKEAIKQFEKLDDQLSEVNRRMRDGRRDVGRYEKGTKALTKAFKAFASATIVLKILELLQTSVSRNSEGAAELEKIWVRVTATFQVVTQRLVQAFQAIQNNFQAIVTNIQLQFAKVNNLFGTNQEEVDRLQKQYDELSKSTVSVTGVFKGMGDEIEDLVSKNVVAIDKTLEYRKAIVANQEALNGLIGAQREQQAAFEDDSTSIEEQIRAGVAYRKSLIETQALEADIARDRQRIAQSNATANPFSIEAREELTAANKELAELLADQAELVAGTEREIQKLRNDSTELSLDFYIDDAQNRIDTNQRIIDDETQTFKRRRELLIENDREREEANNLRAEALNKTLREMGKAELDFEKLRSMTSSEAIADEIQNAGLSEQLSIRALEIIRERRTEIQDSAEAQRDLNEAEAESIRLQSDIILQEEALAKLQKDGVDLQKVLQDLSDARLQNDIDNLRARIKIAEEGSQQFIELNKELNDKLLEQDQARIDKEKKLQQERVRNAKEIFSLLGDIASERSEERIEEIDKEIAAEEERIARLQELAEQGNEDAENNLAITEQRQAELELERERQVQRQARAELALAAVQAYSQNVTNSESPGQALGKTIADISVLRAFVNSLPGFFHGTEDTGNTGLLKDQHGAITGFTHENERVIKAEQNRLIGNMSNAELTALAHRENTRIRENEPTNQVIRVLEELKQVTKDRPVYMGSDYDSVAEMVERRIKKGNKLEKTHVKKGGIWG